MTDDEVRRISGVLAQFQGSIGNLPVRLANQISRALPPCYAVQVDGEGGVIVRKME